MESPDDMHLIPFNMDTIVTYKNRKLEIIGGLLVIMLLMTNIILLTATIYFFKGFDSLSTSLENYLDNEFASLETYFNNYTLTIRLGQ